MSRFTVRRAWAARAFKHGFDGTALATMTDPPVTTVRQPVDLLAAAASALLAAPPSSGGTIPTQIFAPELVIGASTAPGRVTARV